MFFFVDFYILRGRRDNLCDCAGYVKVIMYIFNRIYSFYGIDAIISVMYAEDSYSKWS
jgi:hypothetical protein